MRSGVVTDSSPGCRKGLRETRKVTANILSKKTFDIAPSVS
ncbi:unnamed protein product [Dibothriocephalus latus]|uniref:Uncharacterized protein n=1 Tax=Dibothriocephalus latus TaxID=60516 RepID=A0A3P7N717_DIBLA|nr:unnamed protein product [Dibothriocephalus latus]